MPGTTLMTSSPTVAEKLEPAAFAALLAFVAMLQISIAVAQFCLAITGLLWIALLIVRGERFRSPSWFLPLALFGGATLVSATFSLQPLTSLIDSKQLVLFAIVPIVYRLARGPRALTVAAVILAVGAASAITGIVQYGILDYDSLGRRPQGALTHYMTYSGTLMLVTDLAAARLLFRRRDRAWPALVMPALLVALALTFTRSAWVGTCLGVGLLLSLKDLRLLGALPVLAVLFFGLAPTRITDRLYSAFDLHDPTNRDRIAMIRSGAHMIRDHPLTGVGPDVIKDVYPFYREPDAVEPINPHLHNVPINIAAERGLPALGLWIWFVVVVWRRLARNLSTTASRSLPAAGLAAIVSMVTAGMFEYNFGDSEFMMLWLVMMTLPDAADAGGSPPEPT